MIAATCPVRAVGALQVSRTAHPIAVRPSLGSVELRANRLVRQARPVAVRAQRTEDVDFDGVLADLADKFERADNKAAIVGYGAAAVGATVFAEWLIHLPLFNVLLGFPIQLVGLLLTPYFVVKYVLEDGDAVADAEGIVDTITKKLPGL